MIMRPPFAWIALSLVLAGPLASAKGSENEDGGGTRSFVNTGGSCASEGSWTVNAIRQSDAIAKTITNLKDDPDCKVLVNALSAVDLSEIAAIKKNVTQNSGPGATYEQMPQKLNDLRNVLAANSDNQGLTSRLTPVLAKSTVEMAANSASLVGPVPLEQINAFRENMVKVRAAGENLLSALFANAPQAQRCLQKDNNADAGLNLVGGAIQLMAAFASSPEAHGPGFGKLLSQFSLFLRDMRYSTLQNKLDLSRYWSEMSCLVETTQRQYCDVRDGMRLLEFQAKEMEITAKLREAMASGKVTKNSAIEGYMLLNREVPAISEWLQKVQFGADAKTANDAQFKNDTITAVNALMANINNLQGTYNDNKLLYKSLQSDDLKRQNIRALIDALTNIMVQNRTKINFFTNAKPSELIPFYLIGREEIPDEVLGKTGSGITMEPDKYFLDTKRTPELLFPDQVMAKILDRLTSLSQSALHEGSKYFSSRMSVDHLNLVDDALTDSSINVYQALKNVRSYIARMQVRYYQGDHEQDKGIALSMGDTLARLDRVLARFDNLFVVAHQVHEPVQVEQPAPANDHVYGPPAPPPTAEELRELRAKAEEARAEAIRKAYSSLIESVYDEFNILLQKESFVNQRLTTYVKYDLFERVKHNEDMSPYVQYLLIASGRNVLNRLQEFQGGYNIAESETDLAEAQRINRDNLEVVEDLFSADVWTYINKLAKEGGDTYVKRSMANPYRNRNLWEALLNSPKSVAEIFSHLPNRTGLLPSQDEDGALQILRAKMCTMTLGFKSWEGFEDICRGSVLRSRLTANAPADLPLHFSYDELVSQKRRGVGLMDRMQTAVTGAPPSGKRFEHVCALRDFFRNNQVYWMTLEFGQSVEDAKDHGPNGVKLSHTVY